MTDKPTESMSENTDSDGRTGDYEQKRDELNEGLLEAYAAGFAKAKEVYDIERGATDVRTLMQIEAITESHYYYWDGRTKPLTHWLRDQFDLDDDQLVTDGGQDLDDFTTPAEKHLEGETEVEFQCGVAASNHIDPSDPEYCDHEPETIELDEPAYIDENNRIHVPGRPVECPECGNPVEHEFNGVRVIFA
ncbi:hypothetical protein C437_15326 [Haloarcula vallismortis ATCC 29715]|uniref:Uncharacterized protein n=1 Tax=Haloarcula vallismortis ATCC 29715 TaxID=662477 RepID=M0J0C3_HALVA|nr:hypothetical protein [Haloarcula vallismortis]EMA01803.1 hypothetical protein C437_15326 [Haloarcula vallismortis ATCC 29715]